MLIDRVELLDWRSGPLGLAILIMLLLRLVMREDRLLTSEHLGLVVGGCTRLLLIGNLFEAIDVGHQIASLVSAVALGGEPTIPLILLNVVVHDFHNLS